MSVRRWVVKIGSSLLTASAESSDHKGGLNRDLIDAWCTQIVELAKTGVELVLVSSGAIAEGCHRLGLANRPDTIHERQAAAAVGQMGLIEAYEQSFQRFDTRTAMILLTHDDLSNRTRYLNARSTLLELLNMQVIPVINENDTVVTDEIRFGDNDTLAALVCNLIEADTLVLLTDQDGLHNKDPRVYSDSALIKEAKASDPKLDEMAGKESGVMGSGGMYTKLAAARTAARSGANTVIANGRLPNVLLEISRGNSVGTYLHSEFKLMDARKRWIAGQLKSRGELILDQGAVVALKDQGRSLLAVGVQVSRGDYQRGDMVMCVSADGKVIAKGLVNYSSEQAEQILGCTSEEAQAVLNAPGESELIHRDNLVLV